MAQIQDTDMMVRGGEAAMPEPGEKFSSSYGKTLEKAAAAVPQLTRRGKLIEKHVNVVEGGLFSVFSEPFPNPIPRSERIQ